ncbi:MAG: hypothetical protein ACOX12_03740 [Eggerthellaceae bacterium]|jgi:hypothetical protein
MAENLYNITFTTPKGQKAATMRLDINGSTVSGALIQRKEFPLSGTYSDDGTIAFSGNVKAVLGKMSYDFTGKLADGKIGGVMKTSAGDIPLFGTLA